MPEPTLKKLRVASLRCLGILPNAVRYTVLHPLKPEVIQTLGKALDDQNREVRKMAVDSRAVWYACFILQKYIEAEHSHCRQVCGHRMNGHPMPDKFYSVIHNSTRFTFLLIT